jgi:hypothetical protein
LPPPNGGTPPPDGGNGGGGNGGGNGGGGPVDGQPDVTLTNLSSQNLSLTYRVGGGAPITVDLSAGQLFVAANQPTCECWTLENLTPPVGNEVEGFSIELCSDAQVTFRNSPGIFAGVVRELSGGGASTGQIVFTLQNTSSHTLNIFPFYNGQSQASFLIAPTANQQVIVPRCTRLRVLARDPNNTFADVQFVEPSATVGAIYTYRDAPPNQVEVVKQP